MTMSRVLNGMSRVPIGTMTFEDFMTCFGGRDPATVHMDSTLGHPPDMNFLEQHASTKLYNEPHLSHLELCFWVLTLQSQHSLSNVCIDDILQGISYKIVSQKLNYDACPCDQTLYYGKYKDKLACPKCKLSWYGTTTKKKTMPRNVCSSIYYCNYFKNTHITLKRYL
jgi:hypothetical protein